MKVINLKDLSKKDYQRIINRSGGTNQSIMPAVKIVMDNIQKLGDRAILEKYQQRYGKENYQSIQVTREEIKKAYLEVDGQTIKALEQMIKNITLVQEAQLPNKIDTIVETEKGIKVWREWRPIEKVGLYIPGGKAIYPSSVLMTAIPAQIAGCKEIIMCSPPRGDGQIPSATLVAADMIGLKKIFKVGGVEAIGSMTYGTETIPDVYKIFGAGNSYVTVAKMLAREIISIDMPAGPSEIFIIADETANPKFIAADLLADAEHGEDSACVLITTSKYIAEMTIKEIKKQLSKLATKKYAEQSLKRYGLFAIVQTMQEAIDFTNEYAPEHLEIMTKNNQLVAKKINNAGSVFLGDWTTKSSGDYATGANHVLPTGGMAKMYPPLGVDAFGKWMQVQECTKSGLKKIRKTIETIAEVEQLPAHKNSASIRFIS
ncbi:bifunctional histidinal dehydrogenase and histidinol dehydrogenase [Candidatus Roizmanbacteria bacterium]|nr:bifunctional histidinal dehydrogenase and histidinol dehydrogenase [Candidatus Roizmanbacteria bacterium]